MLKLYKKLTKTKKSLILAIAFVLSIPVGAIIGLVLGLIATTVIPICCDDYGCHNCFKFNDLTGYEATGTVGFWVGLFLFPLIFISLVIYLKIKDRL